MYGFTESFNISVSVALSLFNLTERLRHSNNQAFMQSSNELLDLKLHWLAQTIRDGEQVMMTLADN
jgi:tRNA (guanosine-2'-O-)-methyltransferase